jgi:transcriptional regulator with XRE-family HTH domain
MIQGFDQIQVMDDSERIIIIRKRLNKSQHEFASDIGVSSSYLSQIERMILPVTPSIKARIEDFLKQEKKLYEKDLFSNL